MKPPLEILAYEETPLGPLCLRRRAVLGQPGTFVTEITLNHEFLMSSYNTDSERALAERAIELHGGAGLRVLIGGLGLGYTAVAVLAAAEVDQVEVVEFLPQVIGWLEKGLFPAAESLRDESRFTATEGDIYARMAATPTVPHDLILIDVDHSPDDRLDDGPGFFYTRPGLELAKKHLAPNGVLGVWSYEDDTAFTNALHEVFSEVTVEEIEFENELIDESSTDYLFLARR